MKPMKRRPPRTVPSLTTEQETLLSAITESGKFTLEAVLARHARPEELPELLGGGGNEALRAVGAKLDAELEAEREKRNALFAMKKDSIARTITDANAAFKAGKLEPLAPPSAQSRYLRERNRQIDY